ncbi:LysM peptidoglycan-binding domain-containing protein [Microbacterium dauci]|uniref:LysM peptidoglycan-binding domain-containing protein n=1 Tax=Microbacterium dauci TaxID=3048008 RepID=A0ABT6ZG49_9MICO|nr:LysM peptidoglycan-binding domain-containing protein [Microbacterium sp. LX3-4]MDJ1115134.1 LysM peptidoglycan-binding domain-containing protein [Microbacterium sp. LX3-4]
MHRTALASATPLRLGTPAVLGSIALSLSALQATPATAAPADSHDLPRPVATPTPPAPATVVGIAASSSAVRTHSVAAGDTVTAIAAKHGLRTRDVLTWNGLTWRSVIHPGDILRLGPADAKPAASKQTSSRTTATTRTTAKTHTVRSADTLWAIAQRHGVSVAALASANGLGDATMIRPDQTLTIPGTAKVTRAAARTPAASERATAKSHEVGTGDTLWQIAARHDVSLADLLGANGLDQASIIYPGQRLQIPGAAPQHVSSTSSAATVALDDEQIANVRTIIDVGRSRGVSRDGIAIALGTAMVESWIRNLDWGDRDSLGLFQQRPSAGWGSESEVRDTRRAAAAFFGGSQDPNGSDTRGLLDIDGWERMSFGEAAQAVQISAHPKRYGPWEEQAHLWIDLYG